MSPVFSEFLPSLRAQIKPTARRLESSSMRYKSSSPASSPDSFSTTPSKPDSAKGADSKLDGDTYDYSKHNRYMKTATSQQRSDYNQSYKAFMKENNPRMRSQGFTDAQRRETARDFLTVERGLNKPRPTSPPAYSSPFSTRSNTVEPPRYESTQSSATRPQTGEAPNTHAQQNMEDWYSNLNQRSPREVRAIEREALGDNHPILSDRTNQTRPRRGNRTAPPRFSPYGRTASSVTATSTRPSAYKDISYGEADRYDEHYHTFRLDADNRRLGREAAHKYAHEQMGIPYTASGQSRAVATSRPPSVSRTTPVSTDTTASTRPSSYKNIPDAQANLYDWHYGSFRSDPANRALGREVAHKHAHEQTGIPYTAPGQMTASTRPSSYKNIPDAQANLYDWHYGSFRSDPANRALGREVAHKHAHEQTGIPYTAPGQMTASTRPSAFNRSQSALSTNLQAGWRQRAQTWADANGMSGRPVIGFYEKDKPFGIFANTHDARLTFNNISFRSPEHSYQMAKFDHLKNTNPGQYNAIYNDLETRSPGSLQRHVKQTYQASIDPAWQQNSLQTMKQIVDARYAQQPAFRQELLSTGKGTTIVEDAGKHDAFYGAGEDGQGRNELGKMLMDVRDRNLP